MWVCFGRIVLVCVPMELLQLQDIQLDFMQGCDLRVIHLLHDREALDAQKNSPYLNVVVQNAMKVNIFIRSRALNTRIFVNLWDEMESEFTTLLLNCEIRWLSKCKAFKKLLMLKNKVIIFLAEKHPDLVHHLRNDSWLLKLCYLSDLFKKLNEFNLFLQGESTNVFTLKSQIGTFMKKLSFWKLIWLKMIALKCSHLQKSFWQTRRN